MSAKQLSVVVFVVLLSSSVVVQSVPFVTKRVSLHNPISIDFSGWVPIRDHRPHHVVSNDDVMHASASAGQPEVVAHHHNQPYGVAAAADDPQPVYASMDDQYLTVPVAVETDAEHVLSETDMNQIRDHVITNWRQQPVRAESFPHIRELVTQLLPRPEVELKEELREQIRAETQTQQQLATTTTADDRQTTDSEYTFVKMDKNGLNTTDENLFHAYFAARDHVPPEGYVRLTKAEFKSLFKNAEILFI